MTFNPRTLNIPFSRKVLEHLIAHPEEHNQVSYGVRSACGTALCLAGTAVFMDPETEIRWQELSLFDNFIIDDDVKVGDRVLDIEDRAIELFGLDDQTGYHLFHTYSNEGVLQELAGYIAQAEIAQAKS